MTDTVIRASYTSSYPDCARRGAARMFSAEIESMGFPLRRLPPHIGAVVGTATHVVITSALAHKIETGELGDEAASEELGVASLAEQTRDGVMWDAVTTTIATAQRQVMRQARSYRQHIAPSIEPELVEQRIEAAAGAGVIVSGQIDVYDRRGTLVGDVKTGKMSRWNAPQYGTYSRLLRTDGRPVKRIEEHYLPRVALSESQPRPEIIVYDVTACEQASATIINHIARDLTEFRETGSPEAFLANPMSMLCSDKYCCAWGTTFCTAWRK